MTGDSAEKISTGTRNLYSVEHATNVIICIRYIVMAETLAPVAKKQWQIYRHILPKLSEIYFNMISPIRNFYIQ